MSVFHLAMNADRASVYAAGLAILIGIFKELFD